jgi:uncharacterized membrane protein
MKQIVGIVLVVLGVVGLAWGGFTYTTKQKVLDVGPIHASRDKTHTIPLPPLAGGFALIGGVALLAASKKD